MRKSSPALSPTLGEIFRIIFGQFVAMFSLIFVDKSVNLHQNLVNFSQLSLALSGFSQNVRQLESKFKSVLVKLSQVYSVLRLRSCRTQTHKFLDLQKVGKTTPKVVVPLW